MEVTDPSVAAIVDGDDTDTGQKIAEAQAQELVAQGEAQSEILVDSHTDSETDALVDTQTGVIAHIEDETRYENQESDEKIKEEIAEDVEIQEGEVDSEGIPLDNKRKREHGEDEDDEEDEDDDNDSLNVLPLSNKRKKVARVISDNEDEDDIGDEAEEEAELDEDDDEYLDEDEAGALRSIRTKGKFLCQNCGKGYTKPEARDAHYQECKGRHMPYKCDTCERSCARKSQLLSHQKTHTGSQPHQCGICSRRFAWANQLAQHAKSHDIGGKPFKCSQCGECFAEASTLVRHVKEHPKEKKYEEVSVSASDSSTDLLTQSLQQSGLKPFGCPICSKSFNTHEYLVQHMRMHTGEKPHVCGECGEKFTWHNQLSFHAKQHPGGKCYKCHHCEERFAESSDLSQHAKIHPRKRAEITKEDIAKALAREKANINAVLAIDTETFSDDEEEEDDDEEDLNDPLYTAKGKVKPFGCDQCGKFFARNRHLASHQRTHTGDKPHPCGLCDKSFSWSNQLAGHIKAHHPGEKAFKCTTCEECFLTSAELGLHNKIHRGSHQCGPCGLLFTNLKLFVKHTKEVHGLVEPVKKRGRKPKERIDSKEFQCDFCGICFARRDNLKEHLRVHTGAKPFQCDLCGKFFRLMGHLVKHKRTHTGEKPYRCETCYKCFSDSSKLARHVQMHTGSRPFICRTCYRYFPSKEQLIEHTKTHAGERKIRKPQNKVDMNCDTCGKQFTGTSDSTKCRNCRQITYECGICGDQFLDSNDLLEHTKLHSGDWAYQYIPQTQELTDQEHSGLAGQTIIQTDNGSFEFTTRQGGNLVIDVPAGATQEVIECILSSSDIVMQDQQDEHGGQNEMTLVNQVHQQQIQLQQEAIQQVNPHDMLQNEPNQQQHVISHSATNLQRVLEPIVEEQEPLADDDNDDDDDDMDDDFFADLDGHPGDNRGKPFECPDCGKKFRREKWMVRHRRQHVKQEHSEQQDTDAASTKPEEDPVVESEAEGEPEMDVDDMDYEEELKPKKRGPGRPRKSANYSSNLTVKLNKQNKINGYQCDVCGKCFATAKWLAKHKDTPHTCAKCDKIFLRAKNLKEHMKTHTHDAKYKCPLCEEPQMKFVTLLKHCSVHEEGNYRCPSCNKLFKNLENMVKHTRYHNQGIQHQCETCGKSFWQKWSLRQHQKVHSGEQPYQCDTCGKCFTNIGNYKSHNRVHTGEKPYICETCGKAFREGGHLVKHRRTHTGEKPYVCNTCTASFTDSSKLARHKKTQHSNFGKGYKCETCGKCFSRIDNLHTHEKTHTGEKTPRKSPSKARAHNLQTVSMIQQDPYHRFQALEVSNVEMQHGHETPGTPNVGDMEHPVHTIEILRTSQDQTDPRTDQQYLTLLVQRLNQGDDSRAVNVNVGQALNVSALEPQVRLMTEPHPVRAVQSYNLSGNHPVHQVHQVQVQQRPNVLNQFANVVDDYAIHYPAFIHRK